jgi:translation initiation factor IF-3|tara:strand:+ start:1121 stop:1417 length:297 start_codon:yes stop_codon:yes gene_type:complete
MQKIVKSQKIKELRLRPNIAPNDLNTKIRQIHKFLMSGHKVRIGVFFKGRENEYTKYGIDIINRIMADISSVGTPDSKPSLKGSAILVVFSPITNKNT